MRRFFKWIARGFRTILKWFSSGRRHPPSLPSPFLNPVYQQNTYETDSISETDSELDVYDFFDSDNSIFVNKPTTDIHYIIIDTGYTSRVLHRVPLENLNGLICIYDRLENLLWFSDPYDVGTVSKITTFLEISYDQLFGILVFKLPLGVADPFALEYIIEYMVEELGELHYCVNLDSDHIVQVEYRDAFALVSLETDIQQG